MTLPFTRKEYVISKYLTAAGVTLAAGILSMIPGLLKAQSVSTRKEFLISTGAVMICAGIFLAILLPMRLKYEIEKCRILMVALIAVIFLLAAGESTETLQRKCNSPSPEYICRMADSGCDDRGHGSLRGGVCEGQ